MSEKTVFISYRRDTAGKAFARSVHDALKQQGYDAFLDVDDIAAGYWAKQILTEVPKRAHFLLLVTPGAMDRCAKQDDWVRREFELAKANQRNIVPVFEESVDIAQLKKECPRSMKGIFEFQGLTLRHESFQHGIETLVNRYIPAHKAPKEDVQPVYIKQPDENKPPIVLVTLLLLFMVAIVAGVVLIFKSVMIDHLTDETPITSTTPQTPKTTTLVLDDVNTVEADNTHVIKLSPPEKKHLSRLINMSGEREQFTLINFPHAVFYTNLEDEDHALNAGESKSLRLILTALTPELKAYPFEIRSIKHQDSIRVSIHLEGDWKAFHQQQLAEFTEKTKALSTAQIYQAAVQLIARESEGLAQGPKQALTGQFLANVGQNDAAVLAFAEAAKTVPKTVERLVFASPPTVITALGKYYAANQDYAKAVNWFTTAAKLGDAEAKVALENLDDTKRVVKEEIHLPLITAAQNSKPAITIKDCAFCPEMVDIPAGSFMMGSDKTDESADKDEMPRHQVKLAGFKLSLYEITQGQWKAVMPTNPSHFKQCGDDCPVENVSWNEVQAFIHKLNTITGGNYRLPSEAEWEYACRAGEHTRFCGSDDLEAVAWYDGNSKSKTHAVGGKRPNAFGLYDMSGNVWEWVQDCYHENYLGAPTDGSVWDDGPNCANSRGVVRGGSWGSIPAYLRSANRSWFIRGGRSGDLGFRLAQD